jgi:choline dehydrogenase
MLEADFVIIGSGSAGSAMAYRLSEDGKHSVIVIEFGGSDIGPLIQMPSALSIPLNMSLYDWGFASEPEPHLGGRVLATPRGKVIGGSSSINGMVYVRGHARDFDHWAEEGAAGWGFADVLPYFKRMEDSDGGEDGWRGHGGPLHVQRGSRRNPLYGAFVEAGRQAGFELTDDYNGSKQEGFGPMEQTISGGRRWSAASAYLKPALKRKNVSLVKGFARRVIIENQRAIGVEIEAHKQIQVVKARREVIVAASSINSPKILMLSGIGPAEHLRENGIAVVADRPGVGRNLQDHMELYIQQESIAADHAQFGAEPVLENTHRRAVAVLQDRGSAPPTISKQRPSCAHVPASTTPTSSTISSLPQSATTARRPPSRTASRRMSGQCARSRAAR